ncbi:hypothetical protein DFH94DRAFT_481974 [Russula ochroleuca]|uniref:Uncharacterized protein n=1 Tax=Russula ochroleuca TaxID=152965 RepID=A0A9P5MPU6_9AGAM|nr:hypothetical protein DFH94DRAFT_481974 [Russula ochroleuca]
MSLLATPLTFLLFFSGFAVAQIVSPNCESTWSWSFNSLNQDPCKVAATMLGTCNGGTFTITPLQQGYLYYGPSGIDDSNLCKCSTVGYSLLSACGGCQGQTWVTWSEYSFNCTRTLPPSQFPNPVPSGIRVPHWALLDVTNENLWDFNKSYAAGGENSLACLFPCYCFTPVLTFIDSPELAPGSTPGPSSPSSPSSKAGDHRCRRPRRHSSNLPPCCGVVILSATASFTGIFCRAARA